MRLKIEGLGVGVSVGIVGGYGLGGAGSGKPKPVPTLGFAHEDLASLVEKKIDGIGSRIDTVLNEVKASEGVNGFLDSVEEREIKEGVIAIQSGSQVTLNERAEEGLLFGEVTREAAADVGEFLALEVARIEAMFEGILVGGLTAGFTFGGHGLILFERWKVGK